MKAIDDLIRYLSRLPGIGSKSAARIAYYLIKCDKTYNKSLAEAIDSIQDKIKNCSICGSFSENDICDICVANDVDKSLICVVENPQDVITIQQAGIYNGLFHVLGGAINPLEGIGADKLSFNTLLRRIEEGNIKEVIIATNPTEEGDTTALFIRHILKNKDVSLTRLASGLPIGGDLEYADRLTLARSLKGRVNF